MKTLLPARRRDVGKRWRLRFPQAGLALLAAGCTLAGAAEPEDAAGGNPLHLSGFGTIGVVHVDSPAGTGFKRDSGERDNDGGTRADIDTRLGLQANYRLSPRIELVGQLVGANRARATPMSDVVSLAFAAWRLDEDVTLRTGRMSADYYLLADYRNVGFAYPFVRPPVESYGAVPYLLDGADLTKSWHVGEAVWSMKAIVGRSHVTTLNTAVGLHPFFGVVVSHDDGDGVVVRGTASRLWSHSDTSAIQPLSDALTTISGLPDARVASEARAFADSVDANGRFVNYLSIGVSYDRGAWLTSLELSRCQPQTVAPYTSAWGIVGHRWGTVTGYAGMSAVHSDRHPSAPQWTAELTPLIGAAAAAQAQQIGIIGAAAAATTTGTQHTFTLGLRLDVSERMAVKLQWDRVHVDAYATRIWSTRTPADAIGASVSSATLDFVF